MSLELGVWSFGLWSVLNDCLFKFIHGEDLKALVKTNFEEMRVYQVAESLADEVWSVVPTWNTLARDTLGKQVIRSADSIGANIAEGSGRGTPVDNRRFLCMARGSLYETQHWLRRAYRRKLLSDSQIEKLRSMIAELAPVLNAYMRSVAGAAQRQKSTKKSG